LPIRPEQRRTGLRFETSLVPQVQTASRHSLESYPFTGIMIRRIIDP
jgi:hypothetical protein